MVNAKNQYIYITTEGETIAPNINYTIENCQVLGIVNSKCEKEAIEVLLSENTWIKSSGFDISKARCIQILTQDIKEDILAVVNYLCRSENLNFEEQLPKDKKIRILKAIKRLSQL